MNLFALAGQVIAEASLAGLQASSIAYASPEAMQAQRAKAANCTPCAAAARADKAAQAMRGPAPAPQRKRPRKIAPP